MRRGAVGVKETFELFKSEKGMGDVLRLHSYFCPKPWRKWRWQSGSFDRPTLDLLIFLFKQGWIDEHHWGKENLQDKLRDDKLTDEDVDRYRQTCVAEGNVLSEETIRKYARHKKFITTVYDLFDAHNLDDIKAQAIDQRSRLKRFKKLIRAWIQAHLSDSTAMDSTNGVYQHFEIVNLTKLKRLHEKGNDACRPYASVYEQAGLKQQAPARTYVRNAELAQKLEDLSKRQERRDERRKKKKRFAILAVVEAVAAAGFEAILTGISSYAVFSLALGISGGLLWGLAIMFAGATLFSNYILFFDTARDVSLQLRTRNDMGVLNIFVDKEGEEFSDSRKKWMKFGAGTVAIGFSFALAFLVVGGVVSLLTEMGLLSLLGIGGGLGVIIPAGLLLGVIYVKTFFYVFSNIVRQGLFGKAVKKLIQSCKYSEANELYKQQQQKDGVPEGEIEALTKTGHYICCVFQILGVLLAFAATFIVSITFVGVMSGSAINVLRTFNISSHNANLTAKVLVDWFAFLGVFIYCANKAGIIVYQVIQSIPENGFAAAVWLSHCLSELKQRMVEFKRLTFKQMVFQVGGRLGQAIWLPMKLGLLMILVPLYFLSRAAKGIAGLLMKQSSDTLEMSPQRIDEIGERLRKQDYQAFIFACLTVILNSFAQAFIFLSAYASAAYARGEGLIPLDFSGFAISINNLYTNFGAAMATFLYAIASWLFNWESVLNFFTLDEPDTPVEEDVEETSSVFGRGFVAWIGTLRTSLVAILTFLKCWVSGREAVNPAAAQSDAPAARRIGHRGRFFSSSSDAPSSDDENDERQRLLHSDEAPELDAPPSPSFG